jgi:two-component system sensor histidine kinase QseC
MRNSSLRLRLIILISLAIFCAWFIASTVAFFQIRHNLEEVFDSQQLLFAKRLASPDLQNLIAEKKWQALPDVKGKALKKLEYDDDALAFAIFDLQGEMLLNDGEGGRKFRYNGQLSQSKDNVVMTESKDWRILWLRSYNGNFIVAVGQELDYREELGQELIIGQMIPWLVILPMLMLIIIATVSRELKPLNLIANKLRMRQPDDASTISMDGVVKEVRPFVDALNTLFVRISGMLVKERRFISDAAHELRTPLAALKVQTEVIQLSDDDPQGRHHALEHLITGIDRASHLVDQLLTLSRLDSFSQLNDVEIIDWPALIESVVGDLDYQATSRSSQIDVEWLQTPVNYQGNVLLLSLLIRNLIDNALRYTPKGSTVFIRLDSRSLTVEDNGQGVSEAFLHRLGERFFRPPGQDEIGSGLGLSIVKHIADFHRMQVEFYQSQRGGLGVKLSW